jgi:hypothetical protein
MEPIFPEGDPKRSNKGIVGFRAQIIENLVGRDVEKPDRSAKAEWLGVFRRKLEDDSSVT